MQDTVIWSMMLRHLAGEESADQKDKFFRWWEQSEENRLVYAGVKQIWDADQVKKLHVDQNASAGFWKQFTPKKIKKFILDQALGNLVGFIVGMWITSSFTHYVVEGRNIRNLFGLAGRRKIAVNDMPEWLQSGIAILLGFIVLELINYFFQSKRHIYIWNYLKSKSTIRR